MNEIVSWKYSRNSAQEMTTKRNIPDSGGSKNFGKEGRQGNVLDDSVTTTT